MEKIIIGLSGGMDSTTLLGLLLEQGFKVHCCFFNYGSKHNEHELKAANNIVEFYQDLGCSIYRHYFDLQQVFKPIESNLLKSGGAIPEGHYEAESMKKTVVPGRNLIFASIMASLAESIGAIAVSLGVHSGDHAIYPDCRPEFINALHYTVQASTDGKVSIQTPFILDNKTTILNKGYKLKIPTPYNLTRTCYKDQANSCGKCGSCQERLEAFKNIELTDPINYE